MSDDVFDFDAEWSLLDVGATSSVLRSGTIRPTVLAFSASAGVEAVALDWAPEDGPEAAFEEARRYVRDLDAVAHAVLGIVTIADRTVRFTAPEEDTGAAARYLAIALQERDGGQRCCLYPVRRSAGRLSLGTPTLAEGENSDWAPLGDVWSNPFCRGDRVKFRPREHAVEPGTPLWQAIVDLTRMRIHDDQECAEEYMSFLDDLRNGVFLVEGRPADRPEQVRLRPRTVFNPLGIVRAEASRLTLVEGSPSAVEKVAIP
ncbi:MAG: hypothetical protein IT208_17810 [Chthonomonadales bacterium]|nr:hypothetical protein [Chthonomonadales bacterium]